MYCNRCKINWAYLKKVSCEELAEEYEVCPTCHSDIDLQEQKNGDKYFVNADGKIIHLQTGREMEKFFKLPPNQKKTQGERDYDEWHLKQIEKYGNN